MLTVTEVKKLLNDADKTQFAALERSLVADTRKGVRQAVDVARRRLEAEEAEAKRLQGMYDFQCQLAEAKAGENAVIVGLDEVGRGPVAGPLAVGAVVLPNTPQIEGLNDSKQLAPSVRERIAEQIKEHARAWTVQYIEPADIDACGMTASLVTAFRRAISAIEASGVSVDVVLLDGNPLRMDPREINVVKGDGKCASIAAASIVAKVERDALMEAYDKKYPAYGFAHNKGYASADHIAAIKEHGLSDIHRVSFCTAFTQESLF